MLDQINPIITVAILIFSVVAHEISHGYVAEMLGDPTARLSGRLSINPIKHIDPFGSIIVPILTSFTGFTFGWAKPVPYNPYNLRGGDYGLAAVALAGPLMNLFIAIFFGAIIKLHLFAGIMAPEVVPVLVYIVLINIVLTFFNLTPIHPFDGSKVFFPLLPYKYKKVEDWVERNQLILLFVFIFFIWGGAIEPIINAVMNFILS